MPKLKRLTREEHIEVAGHLCGAVEGISEALRIAGPALGAARLDYGIKARLWLDARLVMHLQDAWDDDYGGEGNPYRAASREADARAYARMRLPNPWANTP